jgi:hypothetical protein
MEVEERWKVEEWGVEGPDVVGAKTVDRVTSIFTFHASFDNWSKQHAIH